MKTTLTDLIVKGLKMLLRQNTHPGGLPVSAAGGGLRPDVSWEKVSEGERAGENRR
jgi:hypothetical protein